MSRRAFLRAAGLMMGTALAGCAALRGESEAVRTEYQPDARDYLAVAIEHLNIAALSVSTFQSSENHREATFDATGPHDRVERARDAIRTAKTNANGDEVDADIDAVRSYADAVAGTVTAVDHLVTASDRLQTAREALNADQVNTDTAATTLDEASDASSTAVETREKAETALEAADSDRLRKLGAQSEAMREGLDTLTGYVAGVDGLVNGYDKQVAGVDALQTAQSRIIAEEFDDARTAFETAQESFNGSVTAFADVLDRAAESIVSDIEYGENRSRSLAELAGGYVSLLDGRDLILAAERALNEGADDKARATLTDGRDRAATALITFEDGAAILPEEFTAEFETALGRARALDSLATGYLTLLDAHDRIETAESRFESDEFDAARVALQTASNDAVAADETFATGQDEVGAVFAYEFETARNKASATERLADGYLTLLDAQDYLTAGETAFLDGNYGEASTAFERAGDVSRTAETTFDQGAQADEEGLFETTFDRALRRTQAIAALSDGYADVVAGRQQVANGIDHLENREFASATEDFETASETFDNAKETFTDGREAAQGAFKAEFTRALCRVSHLRTGVEHFHTASEAGSNGDREKANQERDAGTDALDRVSDC